MSRRGGYDYDFVTAPPKSFDCPVCLLTFRDPHVISCCGHEFCQLCIERVQRDGKPCPLCNEPNFTTLLHKKLVREVNALVVRCPQKEMGCEWEGELGQVEQHLSPGAGPLSSSGCGYVMVECTFQCGARLQRRMVGEHEMDICIKRPIEMQVASLMRKFEVFRTENKMLKQELIEVKQAHKYVKQTNQKLQKELNEVKINLQTHTTPLPVPPFYFTVPNIDFYKKNSCYHISEAFYSHPGGYKMVVAVYPNGVGDCEGNHLWVGVGIQRGEFDAQLRWPFNGTVTVQIFNCTTGMWTNDMPILLSLEADCTLETVKRCLDIETYGAWGHAFLAHSALQRHVEMCGTSSYARFRVLKVEL